MVEPTPEARAIFEAKYRPPIALQSAIEAIHDVQRAKSERWQRFPERFGIEIALRQWASRVERLAGDYDYLLDAEFHNMQMGRLGLEDMMETAEEMGFDDLLIWMVPLVDEVDEQFRAITLLDTAGYSPSQYKWVSSYWFLRRLPNDEQVLETLRRQGPLKVKDRTERRKVTNT